MSLPLRSHFLIHNNSSDCLRCLFRRLRRYASLLLLAAMVMVSVPPAIAQSTLKEAAARSTDVAGGFANSVKGWLDLLTSRGKAASAQRENRGMPPLPVNPPSVRPQPPLTRDELESRVASIKTNIRGVLTLQSGEPSTLAAIPADSEGMAIHGLGVIWESSNNQVVSVRQTGLVIAGSPGTAILTARVGRAIQT